MGDCLVFAPPKRNQKWKAWLNMHSSRKQKKAVAKAWSKDLILIGLCLHGIDRGTVAGPLHRKRDFCNLEIVRDKAVSCYTLARAALS